jgi:predicted DsbA family dithiol-disulfide isomerase
MHDMLFRHQASLLPRNLSSYASDLGLDVAEFESDLLEPSVLARINEDVESADRSRAVGTPTFFINGVAYRGKQSPDALEAAVRRAIALAQALEEDTNEATGDQE